MGGYGMGGYGNYWGGGYNTPGSNGINESGRVKSKKDIDNAKFAPLITRSKALRENPNIEKLQELYNEILGDIKVQMITIKRLI